MGVTTTIKVPPTRGVVRAVHQNLTNHDRVRSTVGERSETQIDAKPSDGAFAAALETLGLTAEELLADTATLTSILTYHGLLGSVSAEEAIALDGQSVATINGAEIAISVVDGAVVINDSATVIQADVLASNGVIHVIDTVLLPPA